MTRLGVHVLGWLTLLACGSRDATVTRQAADLPATGRDPERALLVKQADQAFADSQRPDYRRPLAKLPYDRAPLAELYRKACRAGDARSCWVAMEVQDPDGAALTQVTENCRGGDHLSCRALPWDKTEAARTDLPGWAGRSRACVHRETCDLAALDRECQAGFPASCETRLLHDRPPPDMIGSYKDPPAVVRRIRDTARAGCRADITKDCRLLHAGGEGQEPLPEGDRMLAYERLCAISLEDCVWLGSLYLERDELIKARDAFERDCQFNPYGFCAAAANGYLQQTYPEPVPNRGEELWKWACDRGESCTRPARSGKPR